MATLMVCSLIVFVAVAGGDKRTPEDDASFIQVFSSVTRAVEATLAVGEKANLCRQGRLMPELYLLGEQKAGTTSLAQDLISVGASAALQSNYSERSWWRPLSKGLGNRSYHWNFQSWCYASGVLCATKERHFFNEWLELYAPGDSRLTQDFLSDLPLCSERRRVMADYTPGHLAMTPLPDGAVPSGAYAHIMGRALSHGTDLAQMISGLYGEDGRRIRFAVVLRSPLARMQSAWYHAQAMDFTAICSDCKAPTFAAALSSAMIALEQSPPQYHDWVWFSLASRQLEHWRRYFDAEQFVILGLFDYILGGGAPTCAKLEEDLHAGLACHELHAAAHHNTHSHPPLDREPISEETRARIEKLAGEEARGLSRLLASMQSEGAKLVNYEGVGGSVDGAGAWLRRVW
mmetsp:Transcript_4671/g.15067  ORF Transcript_4671/g.15067 Transcript_4671/m.15067 type:complete len:404 (+) Transcript_4671:78-1289(+)